MIIYDNTSAIDLQPGFIMIKQTNSLLLCNNGHPDNLVKIELQNREEVGICFHAIVQAFSTNELELFIDKTDINNLKDW